MVQRLRRILALLLFLALVLVAIQLVNSATAGALMVLGITPRSPLSLPMIFTAPFVHTGWPHLFNNLVALLPLSALCLLRSARFYLGSSLFILATTGFITWLLGRPGHHLGASGWVFGLWSLNLALAWFDRRPANIAIAFLIMVFYGGLVAGLLPSARAVSVESHLAGLVAGIVCAAGYMRTRAPPR